MLWGLRDTGPQAQIFRQVCVLRPSRRAIPVKTVRFDAGGGARQRLRRVWLQRLASFPGASRPSPAIPPSFPRLLPPVPPSFPRHSPAGAASPSPKRVPSEPPTSSRWTPQRRNEIPAAADGVPLTFPPAPISAWASTGSWRKTTTAKTRNSCESTPEWRPCRPQNCAKMPLPRSRRCDPPVNSPSGEQFPRNLHAFLPPEALDSASAWSTSNYLRVFPTLPDHPPALPPPFPRHFPTIPRISPRGHPRQIRDEFHPSPQPTPDGLPSVGTRSPPQQPRTADVPLAPILRGRQLDQAARP